MINKPRLFVLMSALAVMVACGPPPTPVDPPGVMPNYRTFLGNHILGDAIVPGQFEVIKRAGDTSSHYWCAAGEYVDRALGMLPNRRIYIVKPNGPSVRRPGSKSIVFTVVPDEDILAAADARPESDYSLSISDVGENYLMAHARQYCETLPAIVFAIGGF